MPLQFTVLASGSSANSSLLDDNGHGVLIDFGLGPRQLAGRLASAGGSWACVKAALLTHTHTDHWNERTLDRFRKLKIPLYCHGEHAAVLRDTSQAFTALETDGLVHFYQANQDMEPVWGLRCRPFEVSHDGGLTCGFRLEGRTGALAYAADLGCWEPAQIRALAEVEILALEFNHDVSLERTSGRSPRLIARVLSDQGHLSNVQAAELLEAVLEQSKPGRLRHLVQLHLSRECNRPHLAQEAADAILAASRGGTRVHTAEQNRPLPTLTIGLRRAAVFAAGDSGHEQQVLPGFE